uniref:Uncharacterized protein n=1 Tax=Nelumbo nucifera TaxID=4432 RepID=A0A822ZAM3_NELNU|nr:TPA_asm: hypothetical protein HUJ06_014033 [Nelumbo nucifera]DAD41928.1 TPA_asm: hypothetical protein HUJ06_016251 [Nelumbo nucifera]DAD41937.1 TPA_asm: hypothetical protein HUJ06_016260 [Nelumbo nucifera]DAD41949.1 TPA_asm: hypothetical protein HUJ06_016272 [Nelumbo nucifera]DAD41952.1 TPA_asm: hypothetical protein HUJ06_016275 [Nelumbo nucifera]
MASPLGTYSNISPPTCFTPVPWLQILSEFLLAVRN